MTLGLPERNLTVDEFIKFTGWQTPYNPYYFAVALNYFQREVPLPVLRRRLVNPSPWALPRGNAIKLSELMQSIDFDFPVRDDILRPGQRLKKFFVHSDLGNHLGNYFTTYNMAPDKLAIYSDQNVDQVYQVQQMTRCLYSTVCDAYVGWNMKRDPEYRHGGGVQVFIWRPELVLTKIKG